MYNVFSTVRTIIIQQLLILVDYLDKFSEYCEIVIARHRHLHLRHQDSFILHILSIIPPYLTDKSFLPITSSVYLIINYHIG